MVSYKDELRHHGIKGQKWGVRRYRNEDGTLTEKGKKRLKKQQKQFFESASRVSKRYSQSNLQNHDALLKRYISNERQNKLSELRGNWMKIVSDGDDAEDKLNEIAYENLSKYLPKGFDPEDESKVAQYIADEAFDKAFRQAKKENPDLTNRMKKSNKAFDEYYKLLDATAKDLLGDYSESRLSDGLYNLPASSIVQGQIGNMIRNNWTSAFYAEALNRR